MKIKSLLILITFFILTATLFAQPAAESLMNGVPPIRSRQTAKLKQNTAEILNVLTGLKNPFLRSSLNFGNSSANCDDSNFAFAPEAAPCNGFSVTSINFINANRTVFSGTNNTVGVVYRYANAGTAPDGTVLDALVTVVSYNNNHDATATTLRDADLAPGGGNIGFDGNLQPSLEQESNQFLSNNSWTGNITYRIRFVVAGTTTPRVITVAATTIDNDGSNACGGLRESVTYSSALNQVLTSNSTNQTTAGNIVTGPQVVQSGIGTGIDYANAALYVNVSEFNWTYSFATSGGCTNGGNSEDRFGSLNLSCQINFGRNFASVAVGGNVYNDADGLTDNLVDGTGTNAGGLFANLLDGNGNVVSSATVLANGTYNFPVVVSGAYNIQISTTQGIESSAAPAAALPVGWVNTGERLGSGAGSDGTVNGLLLITVAAVAINNANFGIEQRPTANNNTAASQTNPGGTNNATVPATVFSGGDTALGTVSSIRITAFPSNATSITINGTQYTSANFPAGGVTVPTNTSGNPTQTILVDPVNGAVTIGILYLTIDNAGVASNATATASVPFSTVSISGTVFNDVNGLTDSTVNGTGTGGSLHANLLDNGGNVVQTMLVPASGAYSFAGLSSGNYTVQVSINQGNVGSPAPPTALSAGWANTGENLGAGAGNDGTVNGNLPVAIGTTPTNVTNANFGIEQRPVPNNNTASSQSNFGGTINATVPATTFSASDSAPGIVSSIRITAFPSNTTSITINGIQYTAATFPGGGVTIPADTSGNPTQTILVDPFDGAVTVGIPYMATDNAGIESATTATASVPFTVAPTAANGNISGTLYSGGNPIRNTLVVLIDTNSSSRTFARTDANGSYLFSDKEVGKTYVIQPLSNKYSFSPTASVVNLLGNATGLNFDSTAKTYRPKNDFDGDGKSDMAVFRPSDGNWYVLRSSDEQMSVFKFGLSTDIPVSADFDGDGKTDYAVFRPSEGNWYIWQSKTQDLRVENFGLADDRLVPSDFDGDGKADIAVYRNGFWYIRRSSDDSFETKNFGLDTDTPVTGDFDGDGKTDFSVYRPSDGIWYTLHSLSNNFSAERFGLAADVPVSGDFDGDGFADIAQFRNGDWYILGSTTAFEASQFGLGEDKSIVGDYDGDGRADTTVYRNGVWYIRNSGDGAVRNVYFGLPTDILVK